MLGRASLALPSRPVLDWGMKKPSRRPHDRQAEEAPRYWTGAHTTHKLRYHLVLVPKHKNAQVQKARPPGRGGRPPGGTDPPGLCREGLGAGRVGDPARPRPSVGPDPAALQRFAYHEDDQGRHESGAAPGVPGPCGTPVGQQLLGRRLLRRHRWGGRGQRRDRIHPEPAGLTDRTSGRELGELFAYILLEAPGLSPE